MWISIQFNMVTGKHKNTQTAVEIKCVVAFDVIIKMVNILIKHLL